ncbi:ankyrin repeat domain-containing protein [Duganella sp. Root1480D1]|uniref:ankyrin repeat domain-containing protein n=1 Tax=Duganella sp. Root1480D1 TaxID=1736471 RepID=UPI00070C5747|nr:ankyrin repeat domain-containing protein [Duganella sp. Root1480D1]KQZ40980.1 hypothetical protein ASD58_26815 [Duganella sp. Root1480D1]
MRIIVSGPAAVFDQDGAEIRNWEKLARLDNFHLDGTINAGDLDNELAHLKGGQSCLQVDHLAGTVRVHTEFRSHRRLVDSKIALLAQATRAQWSDGLGEASHAGIGTGEQISLYPIPYDETLTRVIQIQEPLSVRVGYLLSIAAKFLQNLSFRGIEREGRWGMTPLMQASADGNFSALTECIRKRANVHHRGEGGRTCLTMATMAGHLRIVELLLDAGADPDQADNEGMSPVIWAANRGYTTILDCLVAQGANLNTVNTLGKTALFYAQRMDVVERLLALGIDPSVRDAAGNTAADHARGQAAACRTNRNWPRLERVAFEEAKADLLDKAR